MKPLVDLPQRHMQTLLALLAEHTPQAQVWAFGSRVNGTAHEGSDLDVVVRNPADLKQSTEHLFELKEAIQESALPMLVELHDWAHLPAAFHTEISRQYSVLQEPLDTAKRVR
ncbi:MAG: nucleotidyltransferase domain-containing protein [Betaproteobacteria bacterium]|nr:nucleotidyltransferase domain-containing protein [Betaproteobacteria bacterium]